MTESSSEFPSASIDISKEMPVESTDTKPSQPSDSSSVVETSLTKTSIADSRLVGFERIDPKFVLIERIGGWIGFLVVGSCLITGLGFGFGFHLLPTIWLLALALLATTILCWLGWMAHTFPRLQYEATGWRLDSCGFVIRTGFFWRKVVSVPRARVQHADVQQGPLMRCFGLAKLIVHTAGTQNASVELQGLNYTVAEKLRDALIEDREMNDGV